MVKTNIKQKRIKYCIEFQPKDYAVLVEEAENLGFTTLSGYVRHLVESRNLKISYEEKVLVKKLADKIGK